MQDVHIHLFTKTEIQPILNSDLEPKSADMILIRQNNTGLNYTFDYKKNRKNLWRKKLK